MTIPRHFNDGGSLYYPFYSAFFRLPRWDRTTLCRMMKKPSMAPLAISCHQESLRGLRPMIFWIVARISTPKRVPNTLPTPPVSSVPPMMEAAMASISLRMATLALPWACASGTRSPPGR